MQCELCSSNESLSEYKLLDLSANLCQKCIKSIEKDEFEANEWHSLNESMWSENLAVKTLSYKILNKINEPWAKDLLDIFYTDDIKPFLTTENTAKTLDSNGVVLNSGDSVSLIKDLDVKGANFTAKRGTIVKNISLSDNQTQIEGRVNGIKIVLLTKFLKKV